MNGFTRTRGRAGTLGSGSDCGRLVAGSWVVWMREPAEASPIRTSHHRHESRAADRRLPATWSAYLLAGPTVWSSVDSSACDASGSSRRSGSASGPTRPGPNAGGPVPALEAEPRPGPVRPLPSPTSRPALDRIDRTSQPGNAGRRRRRRHRPTDDLELAHAGSRSRNRSRRPSPSRRPLRPGRSAWRAGRALVAPTPRARELSLMVNWTRRRRWLNRPPAACLRLMPVTLGSRQPASTARSRSGIEEEDDGQQDRASTSRRRSTIPTAGRTSAPPSRRSAPTSRPGSAAWKAPRSIS